jgi:hypothetical protein
MAFMIGLMVFTVLLIGANFCFLLIGGFPWQKGEEFAPVHLGNRTYTVEKFAVGVSTSVFGATWFAAWTYFLIIGWDSFIPQVSTLIFHVALQFFAAVGLIVSGIGIFMQWKRSKGIFLSSMGILVGSILLAITIYGPRGHGSSVFMYLLAAWTLVVGGFLTTGTYFLDRFTHSSKEQ